MKQLIVLFSFFLTSFASHSMSVQLTVYNTSFASVGNCSLVQFKVIYNTGGIFNSFATSSVVSIASGSNYHFNVTIPDGSTIISKEVIYSSTEASHKYYFAVTGVSHTEIFQYSQGQCSCPISASFTTDALESEEVPSGKGAGVYYNLGFYVSGGCDN